MDINKLLLELIWAEMHCTEMLQFPHVHLEFEDYLFICAHLFVALSFPLVLPTAFTFSQIFPCIAFPFLMFALHCTTIYSFASSTNSSNSMSPTACCHYVLCLNSQWRKPVTHPKPSFEQDPLQHVRSCFHSRNLSVHTSNFVLAIWDFMNQFHHALVKDFMWFSHY